MQVEGRLFAFARHGQSPRFCVATRPHEENPNQYDRITEICNECQGKICPSFFVVWHPAEPNSGDRIVVPLDLNKHRCLSSRRKCFEIYGSTRWATAPFCDDVEIVLGFLFPGSFSVTWDADFSMSWIDFHMRKLDPLQTYSLSDGDGSKLDKSFSAKYTERLRNIKSSTPTLQELCQELLGISSDEVEGVIRGDYDDVQEEGGKKQT